jgi:hypothetical protein
MVIFPHNHYQSVYLYFSVFQLVSTNCFSIYLFGFKACVAHGWSIGKVFYRKDQNNNKKKLLLVTITIAFTIDTCQAFV